MKDFSKKKNYRTEKRVVYEKVKKKRFKIKMPAVILALIVLYLIGFGIYKFFSMNITNIYISGNTLYSDWEIIKKAGLENYPSITSSLNFKIEKCLEEDPLIKKAKVKKKYFTRVYINITENTPVLFNANTGKTILSDKKEIDKKFDLPTLTNNMDEEVLDGLIEALLKLNKNVFNKISEIKFDPDNVDTERILLTMNDGNYVYITVLRFSSLNNYNEIVKTFNNKKGVLYLNSGEYFQILQN